MADLVRQTLCELTGTSRNHFYEIKGDVGMSRHVREREQEDAYTKTESHS